MAFSPLSVLPFLVLLVSGWCVGARVNRPAVNRPVASWLTDYCMALCGLLFRFCFTLPYQSLR